MRIREKRKLQRELRVEKRVEREKKEHKEASKTQDNNNKAKVSGHSQDSQSVSTPFHFSKNTSVNDLI